MDKLIRSAQKEALKRFAGQARSFALAGGTALEIYYLHHRFSADLNFFSPRYDLAEINKIVSLLGSSAEKRMRLESEFTVAGIAKVRFYSLPVRGSNRPLKIDFVEDVILKQPQIKVIGGARIYSVEDIYLHKIFAVSGTSEEKDETGRLVPAGRNEARDTLDIYYLSKMVTPLHIFLKKLSPRIQRAMVRWYRAFSRHELKIALLDLEIYDKKFDAKELIRHLEGEIQMLLRETAGLGQENRL